MPAIVRAWREHAPGGLVVVGVNLQENADDVRSFADEFGMDFPVAIDRNGSVGQTWRIGGPVEGIPSTYFVDAEGIVRARTFGPLTDETLREQLRTIGVD
jgi:cytochrome c biogenesis protein CcmG/thiol:disulfide interchange protein DsbE